MTRRFPFVAPLAIAAAISSAGLVQRGSAPASNEIVSVQLLAINDFHGHLEPPTGSDGRIGSVEAGGVTYLASHLARLKRTNPNTLIVSAGDNIGASPLASALFHDESAIEALGAAGLQVSAVGNHEFDEGWLELYRMQKGGCHPTDGCRDMTPFKGAEFQYLAANVFLDPRKTDQAALARIGWDLSDDRPRPLLPPYVVKEVGGVRLGFIGMTLQSTPGVVLPAGIRGLTFRPEADTANALVPVLRKMGIRTIVVLVHEGGVPARGGYNDCQGFSGPIVRIAERMSSEIDVVVAGHTHRAYNCRIGGKLVTSASSFGRVITKIDLRINKRTDAVVSKAANNIIVTRDVPPSAAEESILAHYQPFYSPIANRVIGAIAGDITRRQNMAGESALGDVIADAVLDVTKEPAHGGAIIAFTNIGGIRADLTYNRRAADEQPGQVTYNEAFTVQPFENRLIVTTMTGDMIRRVLEQQFKGAAPGVGNVLQVSNGVTYAYDLTRPQGQRVDPASIKIGAQTLRAGQQYRVAVNDFLAAGGDGFSRFTEGTDPVDAGVDIDALVAYFRSHSPVTPGPQNRVTRRK